MELVKVTWKDNGNTDLPASVGTPINSKGQMAMYFDTMREADKFAFTWLMNRTNFLIKTVQIH